MFVHCLHHHGHGLHSHGLHYGSHGHGHDYRGVYVSLVCVGETSNSQVCPC